MAGIVLELGVNVNMTNTVSAPGAMIQQEDRHPISNDFSVTTKNKCYKDIEAIVAQCEQYGLVMA